MTMSNLATVLADWAGWTEAEPLQRARARGPHPRPGPEHPITLFALNALARLLQLRDRLSEAEPMFRRLLENPPAGPTGRSIPRRFLAMNNLTVVLRSRGGLDEAEALIRDCLAIRRRVLGPDHAHTLAASQHPGEHPPGSRSASPRPSPFPRRLDGFRRTLGDEHPNTQTVANNLALVLHLLGRLDEAEGLFRRSLAIKEQPTGRGTSRDPA